MRAYVGTDRYGTARTGALSPSINLTDWTEARFRAGWRGLVVTDVGQPIAEIGPDVDTGRRRWWSTLDGGEQS